MSGTHDPERGAGLVRHRRVLTTATSPEEVDIEALRGLAMPWPQEVAR
jgi:hypothetical protein